VFWERRRHRYISRSAWRDGEEGRARLAIQPQAKQITLSENLIPESEQWPHEAYATSQLDAALAGMNQPPKEIDLDGLEERLHMLT